jgi:septum formation protein
MPVTTSNVPAPELILASNSPRRRDLLTQIGIGFRCVSPATDETVLEDESPKDYVARMAVAKALSVFDGLPEQGNLIVLGADTAVVHHQKIMGKPIDQADAARMLSLLSASQHQVYSAVAMVSNEQTETVVSITDVVFRPIKEAEILNYWNTGEPADKAGAYGIQGLGSIFVRKISGSYSNVVGLPLFETSQLLEKFGIHCWPKNLNTERAKDPGDE